MAYENGAILGWVNANRKSLITRWNDGKPESDTILSIACFIVQKEHRGKGVATGLLGHLIQDARLKCYGMIEVYPKKDAKSEYGRWNGPREMYLKAGFVEHRTDHEKVVRKYLGQGQVIVLAGGGNAT